MITCSHPSLLLSSIVENRILHMKTKIQIPALEIKKMKIQNLPLIFSFLLAANLSTHAHARGPIPNVDSSSRFMIYYGDDYYVNTETGTEVKVNLPSSEWVLNTNLINNLAEFDVVVLQPNQPHFTAEVINELKAKNSDIITLGYISIGEDFIDDAIESPLGNGTGMVTYSEEAGDLVSSNNIDLISQEYRDKIPAEYQNLQSFYVDVDTQDVTYNEYGTVTKVITAEDGRLKPDGKPDYNPTFRGYMVNPDTNWRWVIDNMRINTSNVAGHSTKAGLKQLAGTRTNNDLRNRALDFGFDGFFLDTIDTAAPYDGDSYYPWAVDEMRDTVKYISDNYTDKIVFANRGAFYYSAGLQSTVTGEYSIDYSLRSYINAFLYESFRYDSDPTKDGENGVSEDFNENRYNVAPKVMSQASGEEGFTVFSLEYASGRENEIDGLENTAFNTSVKEFGFVSYLAFDRDLNDVNFSFFDLLLDDNLLEDEQAPTWDTTATTDHNAVSTTMRIGAQKASPNETNSGLRVEWDIALDQSLPITYDIIVTSMATGIPTTYQNVTPKQTEAWLHNPRTNSAYEYTIEGLPLDQDYNIQVFANDAKGNTNTDDQGILFEHIPTISNPVGNTITVDGDLSEWASIKAFPSDSENDVLGVSPLGHISGEGNQANWKSLQMAHSDTHLYMTYSNATNIYISSGFQLFIDADNNPETGFSGGFAGLTSLPIGADYLIEGTTVFQYAGGLSNRWLWDATEAAAGYQVGRAWSGSTGEVFLPLSWIGNPVDSFNFIVTGNNKFYTGEEEYDLYPDNLINGVYFKYEL